MAGQALAGLKVVDVSNGAGGGYCTKLLAGLGADVLTVEPPGTGDETRAAGPFPGDVPDAEKSGLFLHLATGKRSVTLNLDTDGGCAILKRLVADADVLVESLPPGTLAGWGLDYDRLAAINPRLVLTSITPFGQDGPYSGYAPSELASWALSGYMTLTGLPEREPLKAYGEQSQYQAGVQAALGTMAAVLARDITGRGQHVDVSATEALTFVLGGAPQAYHYRRQAIKRVGARLLGLPPHAFYPSTLRPCQDGWVHVHTNVRHPDLLAVLMEEPRLADPELLETPAGHADEIDALMDRWLAQHPKREVVALSQEMRVPNTAVQTPAEVLEDAHLRERGYFVEVDHPAAGPIEQPGPPFRMEQTPWRTERAPLLGEHNRAVYVEELGYAPEDLARLRDRGVI
jgi:crotonobetainyl-CoA:carnitine CoA-transferase CaiB-like acyl-CoA transferase